MFFGDESTFDPQSDLVDLKGKVAVVTGGSRGNGYATVKHLARAGAKVYLGCRNDKRAKEAMEYLRWEGLGPGFGEIVWLDLDLSSPKRAKAVAEEFIRRERRLDILVNNAGVFSGQFRGGDGALSTLVTVNYLSPFVFTKALLPLLAATALNDYKADVRIVNVRPSSSVE
ncbi:NAD(P)-binding protein [Marasmius fiardii PR-910]|nr:NAD(P)-binding protein [Marasmius fiardii PR-910]